MKIQHETFFTTHITSMLYKLYKSRISDSRRACLTNGFARLRDDRARLREVCESLASHSQVKIIPYAQPRANARTLKASRHLYCIYTCIFFLKNDGVFELKKKNNKKTGVYSKQ